MTKSISTIGTHNGVFHADEVFGVAILQSIHPKAKVIRTRNSEVLNTCDIVLDVDGGKYDHHTNDKEYRENGIPYASAGLIWRDFGAMLMDLDSVGKIDESLIQGIDATDNGHTLECDKAIKTVSGIISSFNPGWDSEESDEIGFEKAVEFAKTILGNEIRREKSRKKASSYVVEAIENREQKEFLILDKFCPWLEVVLTNEKANDVLFVIFPDKSRGYRIQTVPQEFNSFTARKDLPANWGGKRDSELNEIIGIDDAIFCHPARFIAGAFSKDSIFKMAQLAINE